ncbi:MAG: hypothetical protein AB2799_19155 [Candidatus Thiodiazotropha sp.]
MNRVHDVRKSTWGHAVHPTKMLDDFTMEVSGCLTPLPEVDDFICDNHCQLWKAIKVKPMGDPHDGFFATLEFAGVKLSEGEEIPDYQSVLSFLNKKTEIEESET